MKCTVLNKSSTVPVREGAGKRPISRGQLIATALSMTPLLAGWWLTVANFVAKSYGCKMGLPLPVTHLGLELVFRHCNMVGSAGGL